jgi:hypothetical protein
LIFLVSLAKTRQKHAKNKTSIRNKEYQATFAIVK